MSNRTRSGLQVWLVNILLLLGTVPLTGHAQQIQNIDPSLQRERIIQQQRLQQERDQETERPSDEPVIIGPPAVPGGGLPELDVEFELQEIRFDESAFISEQELSVIAAEYTDRLIRFADINTLVDSVNQLYAEQGIISARALVPPQTIDEGNLRIRLIEGRLGELRVSGNNLTREGFITRHLPLEKGAVVDIPALRDALNRLNRTTELAVQTSLKAGAEPGYTDLSLQVEEPDRASAQLSIDNHGTESTGEIRIGLLAQLYGLFGIDDRLLFYGVDSEGATNGLISYGLPVNRFGTRLELAYSVGDIDIVEGAFAPLDISGDSSSFDVSVTQPMQRGNRLWSDVYLGSSWSDSTTEISNAALSDFNVTRYTLGVNLQGFSPRGYWSFQQGISQAEAENLFGDSADTVLFNGTASYIYRLSDFWSAQTRAGWQYSTEETVSSPLLFQVGGVGSVRGYPEGALGGARGYFTNLEARYRVSNQLSPFVFFDHGLVDDISPDRETANSVGVGLSWQWGRYLGGELTWGQTLDKVLPDQDSGRLDASISLSWAGF